MQTFLPYPSFIDSAKCLDYRRLGKQRVETKQILLALSDPTYGWQNHPIVKMWIGHIPALALYGYTICTEWKARGYKDTLQEYFYNYFDLLADSEIIYPSWLGDARIHDSHKSNLLRKYPEWYSQFNWNVPDNLPYYWAI